MRIPAPSLGVPRIDPKLEWRIHFYRGDGLGDDTVRSRMPIYIDQVRALAEATTVPPRWDFVASRSSIRATSATSAPGSHRS